MGLPKLQITTEVVAAAYRAFEDGIRRWRDLDIAEWLGFETPHKIRHLIDRHLKELRRHGVLSTLDETPDPTGGRPSQAYWINFQQALVVCTLSRTPRAEDVRTVMIQVFSQVVNGDIATAPRMELRALEVAADRIVAPILKEQREFHQQVNEFHQQMIGRMDRQDGDIANVKREVIEIKQAVGSRRFNLTDKTRHTHIAIIESRFGGRCPCCKEVVICADHKKLSNAQDEHFHGPSKRRLEHTWITCDTCNMRLTDPDYHTIKAPSFIAYQEWVRIHLKEIIAAQKQFDFQ